METTISNQYRSDPKYQLEIDTIDIFNLPITNKNRFLKKSFLINFSLKLLLEAFQFNYYVALRKLMFPYTWKNLTSPSYWFSQQTTLAFNSS